MSQVVLDFGSGNTCHNDHVTIKQMIWDAVETPSDKHEVIIKWQLFKSEPPNVPLTWDSFEFAYRYAYRLGVKTTASVFDIDSLRFLMRFDVPFVKIANRPELYELAQYSTRPVYVSSALSGFKLPNAVTLACISNYPATLDEYEAAFTADDLRHVSDHTPGWALFEKYHPEIIEKHYVHVRESGNPDAGPFAVTPDQLAEVLDA
jgi:sialic acid synthase SpsE